MLRVTYAERNEGAVLKLEGQLVRGSAPLVASELALRRPHRRGLVIDLAGVTFVDETGVAMLRRLYAEGAVLVGASLYLRGHLDGACHRG